MITYWGDQLWMKHVLQWRIMEYRGISWVKEASGEHRDPQPMVKQTEIPPAAHAEGSGDSNTEEWKTATPRTCRRKIFSPTPDVPLQGCFTTVHTEDERPTTLRWMLELNKAATSTPHITTSKTKKRWRVIVAGNSLLRGTEEPIYWHDTLYREACCLPGVLIRGVMEKLPSLMLPSLSPLTIIHCYCFTTTEDRGAIKERCWWWIWSSRTAVDAVTTTRYSPRSLGQQGWCTTSSLPWASREQMLASSLAVFKTRLEGVLRYLV